MTWKKFVYKLIIDYCNNRGNGTFTLQELRNEELISFIDNSGTYTLRGVGLLNVEKEETKTIDLSHELPEKKDYLVETYVRNVGWAKQAKDVFGCYCMCHKCNNTFLKEDGKPYIEVHHIIALCNGGEDGIWNLSVLCAHHHRMSHFANVKTRIKLERTLLKEVQCRLWMIFQKP